MHANEEQYNFYKEFAYKAFNYLNGKINKIITNIRFEVDYADIVNFTFANLRRPNSIFLHIDNIVVECKNGYNKNAICSLIIIAITHELFHIEQLISQSRYSKDEKYKKWIEDLTDNCVYQWLQAYSNAIARDLGLFKLDLSFFDNTFDGFKFINVNSRYDTMQANTDAIYKYTIMNVIFRNDPEYYRFENNVLNKYDNIIIQFENYNNFLIKSNGKFCDNATANKFVQLVGVAVGRYDRYTVNVNVVYDSYRGMQSNDTAIVTFTLLNRAIEPMGFGSSSN